MPESPRMPYPEKFPSGEQSDGFPGREPNTNPQASPQDGPQDGPPEGASDKKEGRFSGISRQRWIELMQHYAEIQRYQREHDLEDKGDPPEDDLPGLPPAR